MNSLNCLSLCSSLTMIDCMLPQKIGWEFFGSTMEIFTGNGSEVVLNLKQKFLLFLGLLNHPRNLIWLGITIGITKDTKYLESFALLSKLSQECWAVKSQEISKLLSSLVWPFQLNYLLQTKTRKQTMSLLLSSAKNRRTQQKRQKSFYRFAIKVTMHRLSFVQYKV